MINCLLACEDDEDRGDGGLVRMINCLLGL
jgi:hypothetical protein